MKEYLIKNIGMLATPLGNLAKSGSDMDKIKIVKNACVGVKDGEIVYVGDLENAPKFESYIDAGGKLVTPGLVDAHTHLVFGGWRQHELEAKLRGATYLDILKAGGGILSTVESTRAESEDELLQKAVILVDEMLEYGTTTCEVKSGYGLNYETEAKQLRVINKINKNSKMEVVPTFMGAHAIPREFKDNKQGYIDLLINEILPKIKENFDVEYCDIFCESGVFNPEETKIILNRAKQLGFKIKMHGDEIDPIGGADLAGELNTISAEHLIMSTDEGIKAMADGDTIAVLLPCTSFYLDKSYARARKMIEEGVPVAISTDFNPGSSPNSNLQLAINLATLKYKMTPQEVLTAVTLNPACVIEKADKIGTIEVGKQADIVLWNAPDLNYICYKYGTNLVNTVIKCGEII